MADRYDLVIAGTGTGGASAAAFAASLDLRVVLVLPAVARPSDPWLPIAALAASARVVEVVRRAGEFGLAPVTPTIDLAAVWRRVRRVATASDDLEAHLSGLGVEVVRGSAGIVGPNAVSVDGGPALDTRTMLLCVGSRPIGLGEDPGSPAGVVTIDGLFDLDPVPTSFTVVGGGRTGVAVAQAMARLGATTTLMHRGPSLLACEEPELAARLTERLRADGVDVVLGAAATGVTGGADGPSDGGHLTVTATVAGSERHWTSEGVLVAVGRAADTDGLGLEAVGVTVGPGGVEVDSRGRTSVRSIYAVGAVAGRRHLAHAAASDAVQAVRDAFFPGRTAAAEVVPWCTLTDPELAHAGLTTLEAEHRHGEGVDVWHFDLARTDRAKADGVTEGNMIIVTAKGRLVGAHLLAPGASEVVHELALAIHAGLKLADVAGLVHVQPTLSAAVGQLAAEAASEKAQKLRWLVRR